MTRQPPVSPPTPKQGHPKAPRALHALWRPRMPAWVSHCTPGPQVSPLIHGLGQPTLWSLVRAALGSG